MGVETDLILDSGHAYNSILESPQPSQDFAGVYAKGLDHFNLLSLAALIDGEIPPQFEDPDDAMSQFEMVTSTPDGFVAVWRVPAKTTSALHKLADLNTRDIAARWQQTPFFELMDWDEEITVAFLNDLQTMLGRPDAQDKDVLVWVSV